MGKKDIRQKSNLILILLIIVGTLALVSTATYGIIKISSVKEVNVHQGKKIELQKKSLD